MSAAADPARSPVAVLAGGLGTRLRPAIDDRQKVVAEVGGRPFVAYLLDRVAQAGFREVVLCVAHRAESVEAALGRTHGPLRLGYAREAEPLGTAGALRNALPRLVPTQPDTPVLVLNGDSFCDVDLAALLAWHVARSAEATLVLARVDDVSRYGRVEVDGGDRIRRLTEKQEGAGAGWINAGIYLFARRRLESLPRGPASLERDVLPRWIASDDPALHGYRTRGEFIDIGTPRSYADASRFFVRDEDRGPA